MIKPGILKPKVNKNVAGDVCVGGTADEHPMDHQGRKLVFLLAG